MTREARQGLYDPQYEHDSCGVGFIADATGRPTRRVLDTALEALINLEHRGAIDADGKTGDGAGLLTQIPRKLFLRELKRAGRSVPSAELAVGVFFFPANDDALHSRLRATIEKLIERNGLVCLGWRTVPINLAELGAKAQATAPRVEQALIGAAQQPLDRYEQALYLLRKEIETESKGIEGFYIPSLSSRTIVYKGLLIASQLRSFYPDLDDLDFETAMAVFHQRYSTNTFPNWSLAQPFRMLAHNGEINTIGGNRIWMSAREPQLESKEWGGRIERLKPILQAGGSDSCSLDNALELLVRSGRDALESMMMLIPEAYEGSRYSNPALAAFYDYAACLVEPWDGPAAVAFSDGRFVGAALDRNGLRPARYAITRDGLVVMASEAGAVRLDAETITRKGRLGPGEMIAVDTESGLLLTNNEIKYERAGRRPYARWVRGAMVVSPASTDLTAADAGDEAELAVRMKRFGYTREDLNRILEPMFSEAKEPAGSMGDDTPLAVLSSKPRPLYHYFKQRFAQVTNPAIDPIRERTVMSIESLLGPRQSLLEDSPAHAGLVKLRSPILTEQELAWLRANESGRFPVATLDALFNTRMGEPALEEALEALRSQALAAVENGAALLILSDRNVSRDRAAIPMLLAVGAVHHHLIRAGRRMSASLIAETGDAREDHHVACLIGYGASAVNPYLAFEVVAEEITKHGMSVAGALRNYKMALESGLAKIMSKMGIATVASYCGAQVFEAVGLDNTVIEPCFSGTPSRIGGAELREIASDVLICHRSAFEGDSQLEDAGYYRYRAGGEYHSFNPAVFRALHQAVKKGDRGPFERYRDHVDSRPPVALRDLLEFRAGGPIPIEQVEPAEQIVRRFSTSGMSHGALSREAHETLAIAMNRLGAKSNSGEGGEDPARYRVRADGDWANSRIKQVASARFGVTPEYLVSADELEIKISQGSKPGEGGQLPGHKVSAEIAAIRHSVPGVSLISPPPHHDIYSIEDLEQLIYDLRQVNPRARIAVKLVSESGVGTVAAGVAKARADIVHIAGHDGGTGASPLGSIKNAGTPWELGLAETQQVLVLNDLRGRVRLRVDGGLKTGRDVVIAAMLGAEEFGFATAAVVALGCVMARQCHLNTCPVGIATQAPHLRQKFAGKPEMVISFFRSLTEDVRRILARLGYHSLDQIIGRSELLEEKAGVELSRQVRLNLRPMTAQAAPAGGRSMRSVLPQSRAGDASLDDRILRDASRAIKAGRRVLLSYEIKNTDRTAGAKLAGEIARQHGNQGLPPGTVDVRFRGSAGQSFGAFLVQGVRLTLLGEANDYVGKGMAGGEIAVRPPDEGGFEWSESVILGNTVMYGATGGALFAAGRAGERFCVRNSGGQAVVEGLGDHGCEYMTAGAVVVLGEVGRNFAAGMTGGVAYVLDAKGSFEDLCNQELVRLEVVSAGRDETLIRQLVHRHYELTGSRRAREVSWNWERFRPLFWKVVTQGGLADAVRARAAGIERGASDEGDLAAAAE